MAFTGPSSTLTGDAQASSLLSFMSDVTNDISEAMTKKDKKRKVNGRKFMGRRVASPKRLNNTVPNGKASGAKTRGKAPLYQRGPNSGPSTTTSASPALAPHARSMSMPTLASRLVTYHGQHRRSLPTSQSMDAGSLAPYPQPAHAQEMFDSDLEKVLDDLESLHSSPSSPQQQPADRHCSSSSYGQQAYLGEYPISTSPYSECSDEFYEAFSTTCSPSSSVGGGSPPPPVAATVSSDWAPSGPSQTLLVATCAPGPVSDCHLAADPSISILPYSLFSDQSMPQSPTISELWNSLAYGESY